MTGSTRHVVVMGVSGCGKSTLAEGIARALGFRLAEADLFHPAENLAAMSAGRPLTDTQRWPWLADLAAWMTQQAAAGHCTVMACSALRRAHRDALRAGPAHVDFIHLDGPTDLVAARLAARTGHFMPPSLLASQVATLEPLEPDEVGVVLDVRHDPETLVEQAVAWLAIR